MPEGDFTRVRVGDPAVTNTGQHRYVLTYTLPEAQVSTGELALDIIGTDETLATEQFEIVVAGLDLEDPLCNVGSFGQSGGCDLLLTPDGTYRAEIEDLEPGQGITIGGRITGVRTPPVVAAPPLPSPHLRQSNPARRRDGAARGWRPAVPCTSGRDVEGATRCSPAVLPTPRTDQRSASPASPVSPGSPLPPPQAPAERSTDQVRLVADDDLADLATIEFVPPKGVDPWQGAVLLRERIDDGTVGAWFSGLAARDVLAIERDGDDTAVLRRGAQLDTRPPRGIRRAVGAVRRR